MKSFKDTLDENATWKVKVQGLPGMYMNGKSAGEVKNKLRKLLKNPGDVISDIQRVMPTDVKKDYRLRLTGKRDLEGDDMSIQEKSKGLYYNINKKRKEGRPMRKKGEKGAPTAADFERAAQTAKDEGYSPNLDPDVQKKNNISTSDKKTLGKIADMMKKEKDKNKPTTTSESKVKSKAEYDNEGEMAKQQLRTVIDAAEQLMSMLEDNENMPEWVQSKITKAVDYLDSARDYIKSDDKEVSQQEKYLSFTNHMQKQLDEGTEQTVTEAKNMAQIHNDIKKAMDKTKIGYDIVMRGKKHFVKVNHNDEEDTHKAIKNHPMYVSGKLRVMPVK